MKKIFTLMTTIALVISLCFGLASCKHTHSFEGGKCECGEIDPNYNPPHQHSFVDGKCDCGEIDPNHECIFFEGKCIICDKDDPNKPVTITGSYGVTAEVVGNCEVVVDTVDVKSDEYEDISLILEEGNVNILDKAWVVYNVTVQPENEESEEKIDTGKVSVPAPVPGVEEYVVYEVQEEKVEEVESEYVDDYVVVDTWNFNYYYLVTTEQSFDVVDYYENAGTDTTIPEHINVGEDKAEDAYQKGQLRTLTVLPYFYNPDNSDDFNVEELNWSVSVDGFDCLTFNELNLQFAYQEYVYLDAVPTLWGGLGEIVFAGWYEGTTDEGGNVILADTPYYVEYSAKLEIPAKDLTLYAVYGYGYYISFHAPNGQIYVNGEPTERLQASYINTYVLTAVTTDEKYYYFSHWAPLYQPDEVLSTDPTFVFEGYPGCEGVRAVFEPYETYTYFAYSVCSEYATDDEYGEYNFIINGEDYFDDYYSDDFLEYETFSITAVPVKGCKFVGWAVVDFSDDKTYDSCKDRITSTDFTYVINQENCAEFRYNALVAVYEALPQYEFEASCYFIDDNYGSFASIWIDNEPRGDNFYSTYLAEGEQVTIKAVPEMNCRFEGWYYYTIDEESFTPIFGELASADPEFTFTMGTEDTRVIAKLRCYPTYSISAYAGAGGDIYINGVNHYGSIRHAYEEGVKLTLKVEVKEGFEFKGWYAIGAPTEQLITTDLQFEYTVGTSDADFEARLVPIPMYSVTLEIPYGIIVEFDGVECAYVEGYIYSTKRMEGETVTLKAIDSLDGREFAYWNINGKRIASREYSFVIGTEDVEIQAYLRAKMVRLELAFRNNVDGITPTYSTNYETGERYLSGVSLEVKTGTRLNYGLPEFLQIKLIDENNNLHSYNILHLLELCDVDWGGSIPAEEEDYAYVAFSKVGIYTFTITDKTNPELTASITIVVEGVDETGNYVWISRTGTKYHLYPDCSNMKTATLICKDDAEEAGYEPCSLCYGN